MSLLKSLNTEINGRPLQVNFPDKKTIILRGSNALQVIHVVECLLSQDFTGYYSDIDKVYDYYYQKVTGVSSLVFNAGAILGKNKETQIQGVVPSIHVIRYLNDCKFRSFYLTTVAGTYSPVYNNMTKYSHVIQDTQWIRLLALVNDLVGFELVKLENEELKFTFNENSEICIDGQKLIYTMLAECFLTPDGYSRVLLIPNIDILPTKVQVRFLELLDDINGHTLTLSLADINPSNLKATSIISFLNV